MPLHSLYTQYYRVLHILWAISETETSYKVGGGQHNRKFFPALCLKTQLSLLDKIRVLLQFCR